IVALKQDGTFLVVVVPANATTENQILWLFGLEPPPEKGVSIHRFDTGTDIELGFAARYILAGLAIEPEEPEAGHLDSLIGPFGVVFPSTRVFSDLARKSLPEVDAVDDPDRALVDWLDREEQLFRRLEHRVVAERITNGFQDQGAVDVDGFLSFSLSVQNRRK